MRENFCDVPALCERMKQAGLAAIVAASPHGVFHTSGCLIITHNPIRDRLAFTVTTAAGHQCLIVCKIEESLCRHDSWVTDLRTYIEFRELPTTLLARTLADLGLEGQTVGLELDYLREAYARELRATAPTVTLAPCDALLLESRLVKPARQIARMRAGAEATLAAVEATLPRAVAGVTERQLRVALRGALAERGADGSYVVVAAGPHSVVPGHRATERRLEPGDPVVVDASATFDGYVADAAASIVVADGGAPPAGAGLEAVYRAAAEALGPGAAARDVYGRAADTAARAGGGLVEPLVGHGVSYGGQEPPFLAPDSADVLRSGMTIALDVHYRYGAGRAARIKRMWVIEERGASELARQR